MTPGQSCSNTMTTTAPYVDISGTMKANRNNNSIILAAATTTMTTITSQVNTNTAIDLSSYVDMTPGQSCSNIMTTTAPYVDMSGSTKANRNNNNNNILTVNLLVNLLLLRRKSPVTISAISPMTVTLVTKDDNNLKLINDATKIVNCDKPSSPEFIKNSQALLQNQVAKKIK